MWTPRPPEPVDWHLLSGGAAEPSPPARSSRQCSRGLGSEGRWTMKATLKALRHALTALTTAGFGTGSN
jgi:hypothetical protein